MVQARCLAESTPRSDVRLDPGNGNGGERHATCERYTAKPPARCSAGAAPKRRSRSKPDGPLPEGRSCPSARPLSRPRHRRVPPDAPPRRWRLRHWRAPRKNKKHRRDA